MGLFASARQMFDGRPGSPVEDWLRRHGVMGLQTPSDDDVLGASLFASAPPPRGLFASRSNAHVPAASPQELVKKRQIVLPMRASAQDYPPIAPPPQYNLGTNAGREQFRLDAQAGNSQMIVRGRTEGGRYAQTLGNPGSSPGFNSAVQDFWTNGPTAYGQNIDLRDARLGQSNTNGIRGAAISRVNAVTSRTAQSRPTAARIRANEAAANRRAARAGRLGGNGADAPNAAKPVHAPEQPLGGQADLPAAPYRSQVDPAKNAQLQAAFDHGASLGDLLRTAFSLGIQFDTASMRRAIAWRDKGGKGARILPEEEKGPRPPLPGTQIKALTTPDHPFGRTIPERVGNIAYHLGDALGFSHAGRMQREAQTVSEWLPLVGGAASIEQAGTDFEQGRYGSAAANATLGAFDGIPAMGAGGRFVGRTGKHVIDSAGLRSVVSGRDGSMDTAKAGEYLRNTADEALSRGGRVTLHVEGRAIPITKPGLVDDADNPWGATPFLSPGKGDNPRLEIDYPGERPETGPFGRIHWGLAGDYKGAVARLTADQAGEVPGALFHPEVGDIALVWGKEGTGHSDGYGLAKLLSYHADVIPDLPRLISEMKVVRRSPNRIRLESPTHTAGVRLDWDGKQKTWLITAYQP